MVFFTCNSCGESLKKAQIEKHIGMCRGCSCLSCIDCGKDFWGQDYKNHVRCISEDQKYGGRGYEAKANKGDVKQQQWIQRIQDAMSKPGISPRLKDVLNQVSAFDNVPRKKAKFQNWMKSSLRIRDDSLQNQVWDIISAAESSKSNGTQHPEPKPDPPPVPQLEQNGEEEKPSEKKNKRERKEERQKKNKKNTENGKNTIDDQNMKKKKKRKRTADECEEEEKEGQDEEEEPNKKQKKRKGEEPENQNLEDVEDQQEDEDQDQDQASSKGKFNWKGTIKAVLRQGPDEGLPVKKLRKKVLAAYYSFSGDGNFRSEEELFSTFNKRLSGPRFKVLKDKVRLVK